jgi:hypothetical protein
LTTQDFDPCYGASDEEKNNSCTQLYILLWTLYAHSMPLKSLLLAQTFSFHQHVMA